MTRTSTDVDANGTHADSRPVRYQVIDKDGRECGTYPTATAAARSAQRCWPSERQDPERTGAGWDVQVQS